MKLYFLRHGIAVEADEWNASDETRPLTPDGKARMAREAETLARLVGQADVLLTSPLTRAIETADIAADAMGQRDLLEQDTRLSPGFGTKELTKILAEYTEAKTLLLVGHEPDFSSTIETTIGGGRIVLKKGGLALVEVTDVPTMHGVLVWLLPPKALALE